MDKIRVVTLFSGYDSQCLALERLKGEGLGFDYELVAWSDIDRYAIRAHDALFPQWSGRNVGDVSGVDWGKIGGCDLLTYSFPCTNISMAGRQEGLEEDSGTASSLLWECRDAIGVLRPRWALMENVANLLSPRHRIQFDKWCDEMEGMGYRNYWRVMNSRDYGVPQNRRRVFMLSVRGDGSPYEFPEPFGLERCVSDLLEDDVDESLYLGRERIDDFLGSVRGVEYMERAMLGWTRDKRGEVVDRHPVDVANCVTANKRDNTQNYVFERLLLNGDKDGCACTVTSAHDFAGNSTTPRGGHKQMGVLEVANGGDVRIRRLTCRELYRIMDVDDKYIDVLLSTDIPKTQHAKMAGNSIVVSVLYHIFKSLFVGGDSRERGQLSLF